MPICTTCGTQNPENTSRCIKCGVGLGTQLRAQADARRGQSNQIVRTIMIVAVIIVVGLAAFPTYKALGGQYYKFRLKTATGHANGACDGPVTDAMQPSQKETINKCLAENADLKQAQADYDNFTH